jgi:kumamolisin
LQIPADTAAASNPPVTHGREMQMTEATFTSLLGSRRIALPGAKAVGRANAHAMIEVLLKLRRKSEPCEPIGGHRKAISREELAATFGSSQADIGTVSETFRKLGLQVVKVDPATRSVELSGTVAQMERAFQTRLFEFSHPDGNYRGRTGELKIPSEIKDIIEGVFGMDDRRVARRRRRPSHAGLTRDVQSVPASWYVPAELAARYKFPPGNGTGQAVGVLEFGGGYFPADLQTFCTEAGVAVPNVVATSVDGTSTSATDGAEGEVMLDIEVVAGVCPMATIVAYFAHFGERGFIKALDAAVQDATNNPKVLSISWGNPEEGGAWSAAAINQVNKSLQDAALTGMTVCVAAGDDGSSDALQDGLAHVDFPASSPYVLAVGGTTIPSKTAPLPDPVWFEGSGIRDPNVFNSGSTGGGVSDVFPLPSWQQAIEIHPVNPGARPGRVIPDLAANADWGASPYLLVVDGQAGPNGGTSAATPLVASMIALINGALGAVGPVGYLTPLLYGPGPGGSTLGSQVCTDIVSGGNATAQAGGYSAGPGYDAVSGWGCPNGSALLQALQAAAAAVAPQSPADAPVMAARERAHSG